MIKADIVRVIAEDLKVNDRDALGIVDHIIESLKLVVQEHERLEIRDFGVFQVRQRKARVGRNPRNKKEYPIAPHKVVTFKPGKNVKVVAMGAAASAGASVHAGTAAPVGTATPVSPSIAASAHVAPQAAAQGA